MTGALIIEKRVDILLEKIKRETSCNQWTNSICCRLRFRALEVLIVTFNITFHFVKRNFRDQFDGHI